MVRAIAGHGRRTMSSPPCPAGTGSPCLVTTCGSMPKKGRVAEPGLAATAPGMGAMRMAPVSVCHQVSTMGQRALPMTL